MERVREIGKVADEKYSEKFLEKPRTLRLIGNICNLGVDSKINQPAFEKQTDCNNVSVVGEVGDFPREFYIGIPIGQSRYARPGFLHDIVNLALENRLQSDT